MINPVRLARSALRIIPSPVMAVLPFLGAAAAGSYLGNAGGAAGYHEDYDQELHNVNMHHSAHANDEFYCLDKSNSPQLDLTDANEKLRDIIKYDNPVWDWDNFDGTLRIFFWQSLTEWGTIDCDALGMNRARVPFEFHINNNNAVSPCTNTDGVNCVHHYDRIVWGGHTDYGWVGIYLDTDDFYAGDPDGGGPLLAIR